MNFGEMILLLCEYYNEPLKIVETGKENIRVKFLGDWILENLPAVDYSEMYKKIIQEFKPTAKITFPMIPHLKEIFFSEDKDEAIIMANMIIDAIIKYDVYEVKRAQQVLGELGWDVVKMYGGWGRICKMIDDGGDLNVFRAQLRDSVKALKDIKVKAEFQEQLSLPASRKSEPIAISDFIKGDKA
jgi:hypothetical protein